MVVLRNILILLAFTCFGTFSQSVSNWTQYRGNKQLTGVSDGVIPSGIQIKWTFDAGDPIKSSPVVYEDKIIMGSTNGVLYCIGMEGELIWKHQTGNAIEAPALILDKKVYIGNLEGILFSFDLTTGDLIWKYETENQIMGAPNWYNAGDKNYIMVGSYDFYLHAVDASSGSGLWKYELDNYLNSTVSVDDEKAIFAGCDGFLHIVNPENGTLRDKYEIASYIAGSPAMKNDIAYLGDYDGGVTAVDIKKESTLWKWNNEQANLPFIASPALHRDKVYLTSRDKYVYCFKKDNGELIWKRNSGFRIDASPLVTRSGLLVANMRGDLQLLNLYNGQVLWSFEVGSPIASNPALYKNNIILGAQDGLVYCIGK